MEEDIEILKEWIEADRRMRNYSTESDYDKFCEEKCIAIENLISENKRLKNNYNKALSDLVQAEHKNSELKKINEAHQKENGELRKSIKELEEKELDYTTVYLSGVYDERDKWKEKIKDEIEEYKKMLRSCNRFSDVNRIKAINERILVLEELLEDK